MSTAVARAMAPWHIVDGSGEVVMTAAAVTSAAKRERRTPRQIAEREARMLVNPKAGDAPVFAVRVGGPAHAE